jgi:hypothetical protein
VSGTSALAAQTFDGLQFPNSLRKLLFSKTVHEIHRTNRTASNPKTINLKIETNRKPRTYVTCG